MKKPYAAGDKVQLSAAFINLAPSVRYDSPESIAHRAAMVKGAGVGTITMVYPSGKVSVEWQNGFGSAVLHPRFVKRAK